MDGHKTARFYGEPDGQYTAALRAVGEVHGVDYSVPWENLSDHARQLALDIIRRADWIALLFVAALLMGCVSLAAGEVVLRLDPPSQTLDPGASGSVSLMLDDAFPVRTAEITLRGDPDIITTMVCTPGAMFDPVPCFLWEESEELEPGVWHGFVVIIGSSCQAEGPGELLHWDFVAGIEGHSTLESVEVKLYAPDGVLISDVSVLAPAEILVWTLTGVTPATFDTRMTLSPNPFNPAVGVTVDLDVESFAHLTVFDARGRQLAAPWSGLLPSGPSTLTWRGRGFDGRSMPSGVYRFVLDRPGKKPLVRTGTLLR